MSSKLLLLKPQLKKKSIIRSHPVVQQGELGFLGKTVSQKARPEGIVAALREFREQVILREMSDNEPDRCILRDEMIKAIVQSDLNDPDDFHSKISASLRSRTDGRQMKYLEGICDIVGGVSTAVSGSADLQGN